jgi:hypothetical protein
MHGRTLRIVGWFASLLGAVAIGCDAAPPISPLAGPLPDAACDFNPAAAGTVTGQVLWKGDVPSVVPFDAPLSPFAEQVGGPRRPWPNPNAPVVDRTSHGVGGAVVFLRGVDPRKAKPWDQPPVRVVMRDYQIYILQGTEARTGFVRRGDTIEMISEQPTFDSLQARGAAFFSLPFPDANQPRQRLLHQTGQVELSSAAGHFWMRGYLFVDDHPYYTRTDARGRFRLEQVPPGKYELVCWLPDWHEAAHELDGDTSLVCRLTFRAPVELVQPLELGSSETKAAHFTLSADLFGR